MKPQHTRLAVIILLFLLGAWNAERALPPLEGGDEWLQLAYIEHLRTTLTLPDRAAALTSPVRQQAGQPPLTYIVSAFPAALVRLPSPDMAATYDALQTASNNWFAPPDRFNRTDNNNVFYLSNAPANDPATLRAGRAARLLVPLWGVVGILATYAAAWQVFRRAAPSLAAAALFAFTPTYLHINTFPNTDSGAAALGAVVVWLALWAVRGGVSGTWAAVVGLVLGLAGLAKVSAVLVGPAVAVAAVLVVLKQGADAGAGVRSAGADAGADHADGRGRQVRTQVLARLFRLGAIAAVPFALTFGVWVLWGALAYGDPLGTGTHRFEGQVFDPALGPLAVFQRAPEVYLSYWGKFASAVYLHPATYAALSAIPILALAGWRVGLRRGRPAAVHAVLWTATLVPLAGLYYWLSTINFITGRLLFPAHAALCILLIAGMRGLRWGMWGRLIVVGLPMLGALVLLPTALTAAYRQPITTPEDYPLTETVYTFEQSIRLMGWTVDAPEIVDGEITTFTTCWEVLADAPRPAAYSLRAVRDGVPVGERTTVHGTGRYDWQQWEVGRRFCDVLDVPMRGVEPGARYDVLLVMLDAETGAVDWEATNADGTPVPFPVLGSVTGAVE